jgi:hypothetical protein
MSFAIVTYSIGPKTQKDGSNQIATAFAEWRQFGGVFTASALTPSTSHAWPPLSSSSANSVLSCPAPYVPRRGAMHPSSPPSPLHCSFHNDA